MSFTGFAHPAPVGCAKDVSIGFAAARGMRTEVANTKALKACISLSVEWMSTVQMKRRRSDKNSTCFASICNARVPFVSWESAMERDESFAVRFGSCGVASLLEDVYW